MPAVQKKALDNTLQRYEVRSRVFFLLSVFYNQLNLAKIEMVRNMTYFWNSQRSGVAVHNDATPPRRGGVKYPSIMVIC